MAQFKVFEKGIEVSYESAQAVIQSMERGRETRMDIMKKHNVDSGKVAWIPQQTWLNVFQDLYVQLGEMNIFMIGKAVMNTAKLPKFKDLHEALSNLDVGYHMNHRKNGKVMFNPATGAMLEGIGHYQLKTYDEKARKAVMVCTNPYPSKLDEGIITQMVRNYKPKGSRDQVELDTTKGTRTNGADSCTYNISW